MKSTVTSDGLKLKTDVTGLARLRALTRQVSGKQKPTMADVKKLVLAAHNAFCPEGCRYPLKDAAKRVTIVIS